MRKLLTLSILAATFLLVPASAQACMECCGWIFCRPCWEEVVSPNGAPVIETQEAIEISFPAKNRAVIKVPGYWTTHLQPNQGCVVAVPPTEGVEKVNAVVNFDSRLGQPFEEVTFDYSSEAGALVADFMADYIDIGTGEPWQALVSTITGSVNDGVPNHFLIDVSIAKGVTPHEFVKSLRDEGMFLTAAAHDGVPHGGDDGGHIFLKRFADFEMIVKYPAFYTPKPNPSRP